MPDYVLGHTPAELKRLRRQHRLIGGFTRRLFVEAGIASCRRVLDVGCGAGDVTLLAAELVGPGGSVIGVDRETACLGLGRERASAAGFSRVTFQAGDPAKLAFEAPFDAVVGRYVLLFQADQAGWLRALAALLRPGGLLVLHEPDFEGLASHPPVPLYDQCCHWVQQAFARAGTPVVMASRLHGLFRAAGLPAPQMRLETALGGSSGGGAWLEALADLAGSLAPAIESAGLASAASLDPHSLAARLRQSVEDHDAVVIGRSEVGAWCRLPVTDSALTAQSP
ncbi:MAG: class I SAM-dependent methyltransferase [Cyanobium sp.]